MDKRRQGDIGVASAVLYFTQQGYIVSSPLTEASRYDLVVDNGTQLQRVQVKTTNFQRNGVYLVEIKTTGVNMSGRVSVKKMDAKEFDLLFILAGSTDMWVLPSSEVDGMGQLSLGTSRMSFKVK